MMTISIRDNFPQIADNLNKLPGRVADIAVTRALNASVSTGKIRMAREISSEYRLSRAKAAERLIINRATRKGRLSLSASLRASGSRRAGINLISFVRSVPSTTGKRRGQQIKFQVKRKGGAKQIPGAFIGNTGRTVFIRTSKSQYPIKALSTIDIPSMFNSKAINSIVRQAIIDRFPPAFKRELRSAMRGFVK